MLNLTKNFKYSSTILLILRQLVFILRAVSEVVALNQLKLTENIVILLFLIVKRKIWTIHLKNKEYLNSKFTIRLSPSHWCNVFVLLLQVVIYQEMLLFQLF